MPVPTYSLLTNHEDTVTYRIPDPIDRTHAYIEVGLYSWELTGASSDAVLKSWHTDSDPEETTIDGVGLRLQFSGPTRHHPTPPGFKELIHNAFETFSSGSGTNGYTFRIQNTQAGELREAARSIAQYAHCYWWALDQSNTFTPGVQRDETHSERKQRLGIVEHVHNDGTVVLETDTVLQSPYSINNCELKHRSEWATPTERCQQAIDNTITDLLDTYPPLAVKHGYREANTDRILSPPTKTDELKQKEELEDTLRDINGVGMQYRRRICNEFQSLDDLGNDIRGGGECLRSMSGIGETTVERIADALIETDTYQPAND